MAGIVNFGDLAAFNQRVRMTVKTKTAAKMLREVFDSPTSVRERTMLVGLALIEDKHGRALRTALETMSQSSDAAHSAGAKEILVAVSTAARATLQAYVSSISASLAELQPKNTAA